MLILPLIKNDMPKNINSVQAGTVQENNVNNPQTRVIRGKNQFPQSFQHPSSTLYGVVDPVGGLKCEPGDVVPYIFNTDLNTFTMQSPMKSKVNMYSAAFKVPMEAIYPRNYDLMFAIPNKGDDVPQDVASPSTSTRAVLEINRLLSNLFALQRNINTPISFYVRICFLIESIISDGSLLSKFNIHLPNRVFSGAGSNLVTFYYDDWIDAVFSSWLHSQIVDKSNIRIIPVDYDGHGSDDPVFFVTSDEKLLSNNYFGENHSYHGYISFSRAFELLRSGDYVLDDMRPMSSFSNVSVLFLNYAGPSYDVINIEYIFAYQLACSHFFNNPKIDYIYSADLYRDNLEYLWLSAGDGVLPSFRWNSLRKFYDVASGAFLNAPHVIDFVLSESLDPLSYALSFWNAIFNFQNSLRYGDYFTGARPEPIGVGDTNIDDPSNPLEITRKLQLTRLLHKVNIAGPRKDDYLKVVFGGRLPETPSDVPIRLSVQSMDVEGFETNNTGDAQLDPEVGNITTTNLRLTAERVMFEVEISEPCYLIMVQYFDAHRIYSKTVDRFAFHFDRYDDFIPDLQFIGDQDVSTAELLGSDGSLDLPFAYNLRYMEYKQRYSYASGAFVRKLRSWAFVTDNLDGNPALAHISPEYIRSSPSEFDRFYKSLTGWSLATRYHFMTFNTNILAPYRQMVYAPEILA